MSALPSEPKALAEFVEKLPDFLDELREQQGYNIGTQQYIATQDLIVALAANRSLPATLQELDAWLAPLLCSSPEEQKDFPHQFAQWLNRHPVLRDAPLPVEPPLIEPQPTGLSEQTKAPPAAVAAEGFLNYLRNHRRAILVGLSLIVLVFCLIIIFVRSDKFTEETGPGTKRISQVDNANTTLVNDTANTGPLNQNVNEGPSAENTDYDSGYINSNIGTNTNVGRNANTGGNSNSQGGQAGNQSTRVENWEEWYRRHFSLIRYSLAGAPLFFFGFWWIWRYYRRRTQLERWASDKSPRLDRIVVKGARERLFRSAAFRAIARELRRHRRFSANQLDVAPTVKATVQRGGLFTPVHGSQRALPEYLVLIDRAGYSDQQASLHNEIIRRLWDDDVFVDRYFFHGDPRICQQDGPASPHVLLEDLVALHPDHYLVIFGDGSGLLNPLTGQPQSWLSLFSPWRGRALLTPEPVVDWEYREWALANADFLVLPANEDGLKALVRAINTGAPPRTDGVDRSLPYPELLRDKPDLWLERHAPSPKVINKLCAQLRRYLGGDSYHLLNACAIYPVLQWDLTLYLATQLIAPDELENTLSALVRLPWFRHGWMPDWLRLQLIADLPPERETGIREKLELLLANFIQNPRKGFQLSFVPDPAPAKPGRWQQWREKLGSRLRQWQRRRLLRFFIKTSPEDSPLRDYVFLNFISDSKLAVAVPDALRRFLFKKGRTEFGLRAAPVVVLALTAALLIWALLPKPSPPPEIKPEQPITGPTSYPTPDTTPTTTPTPAPDDRQTPFPQLAYRPTRAVRGQRLTFTVTGFDCSRTDLNSLSLRAAPGSGITVNDLTPNGCQLSAQISVAPDARLGNSALDLTRDNETVGSFPLTVSERPQQPCPKISIIGGSTSFSRTFTFSAVVSGARVEQRLTYRWTVNAGRILSGQGTPKIEVEPQQSSMPASVAVTVGGLDAGCPNTAQLAYSPNSGGSDQRQNRPPVISDVSVDPQTITICPRDSSLANPPDARVRVSVRASDPDGDRLIYQFAPSAGRFEKRPEAASDFNNVRWKRVSFAPLAGGIFDGRGSLISQQSAPASVRTSSNVMVWDLSGVPPGTYRIRVQVLEVINSGTFGTETRPGPTVEGGVTILACSAPNYNVEEQTGSVLLSFEDEDGNEVNLNNTDMEIRLKPQFEFSGNPKDLTRAFRSGVNNRALARTTTFNNLPSGVYMLIVSSNQYYNLEREISVKAGGVSEYLRMPLKPRPSKDQYLKRPNSAPQSPAQRPEQSPAQRPRS